MFKNVGFHALITDKSKAKKCSLLFCNVNAHDYHSKWLIFGSYFKVLDADKRTQFHRKERESITTNILENIPE